MDLEAARRGILAQDGRGRDEDRIEVNQRHLIDKILARYSAEHTIYREVLQNADDAEATAVDIVFELEHAKAEKACDVPLGRAVAVTLRNNGRAFSERDWGRLRKIAEGNPDEAKIGFFGVGFYSLFSVCEEPFVLSGSSCLAFYWRGDQLFARSSPAQQSSPLTTIYLRLREPLDGLPAMDAFAHFCTKSLLFTRHLARVTVSYVTKDTKSEIVLFFASRECQSDNTWQLGDSKEICRLNGDRKNAIFTITSCTANAVTLVLDKKYKSARELPKETSLLSSLWTIAKAVTQSTSEREAERKQRLPGVFKLNMRIVNADVKSQVPTSLSEAMERTTKKKPPAQTRLSLLYQCESDDYATDHPVLKNVLPRPGKEHGRVHIGFETHQTTGLGVHIAGAFIPTVERESLDFVDRALARWNTELLDTCGRLARILYDVEIQALEKTQAIHMPDTQTSKSMYTLQANHVLASFAMEPSSPSAVPGHVIRAAFLSGFDLRVPSSSGIVAVGDLRRIPIPVVHLKHAFDIPSIDSGELSGIGAKFLNGLGAVVPEATVPELVVALDSGRIAIKELFNFITWSHGCGATTADFANLTVPIGPCVKDTFAFAKVCDVQYVASDVLCAAFKAGRESLDEALIPNNCLAIALTKYAPSAFWCAAFGIAGLESAEWLRMVCSAQLSSLYFVDLESAERLLAICAYVYDADTAPEKRAQIASLLAPCKVIPCLMPNSNTRALVLPNDVYLESVRRVASVPIVALLDSRRVSDAFLVSIGVRAHLDVSAVLRDIESLEWGPAELVVYVRGAAPSLSRDEMKRLKAARVFPVVGSKDRLSANDVYFDDEAARLLNLPILAWSPNSNADVETLTMLGVRRGPQLSRLLGTMASTRPEHARMRPALLRYFVTHIYGRYGSEYKASEAPAFLPLSTYTGADCEDHAVSEDSKLAACLGKPSEIFVDEPLAILGLPVIHSDLHSYAAIFGVSARPPAQVIVKLLQSKAFAPRNAAKLFAYLSTILADFGQSQLSALSTSAFVPITDEEAQAVISDKSDSDATKLQDAQWYPPVTLFFRKGRFGSVSGAFQTVERFGTNARPFLAAVGVQEEPRPSHIAQQLVAQADSILASVGPAGYIEILRWLAESYAEIQSETPKVLEALATRRCLLGYVYSTEAAQQDLVAEATGVLCAAADVHIADDPIAQTIFEVAVVPGDPTLERFYASLGCKPLSAAVQLAYEAEEPIAESPASRALATALHVRAPLIVAELRDIPAGNRRTVCTQLSALKVHETRRITVHRRLQTRSHTSQTSAAVMPVRREGHVLVVTPGYDAFDVASAVAKIAIGARAKVPDALLIATLLTSPLGALRAKGFAVDRVLGEPARAVEDRPAEKAKAATSNAEQRRNVQDPVASTPSQLPVQEESRSRLPEPPGSDVFYTPLPDDDSFAPAGSKTHKDDGIVQKASNLLRMGVQRIQQVLSTEKSVPSPAQMQRMLEDSIGSLRVHDGSPIDDSRQNLNPVSPVRTFDDACRVVPGENLVHAGTISGVSVYFARSHPQLSGTTPAALLGAVSAQLAPFVELHVLLARRVFGAPPGTYCVYWSDETRLVAFNRGRTLFFNYGFYARAHAGVPRARQLCAWFMVWAHELAHNTHGPHDAAHEALMAAFAETYMSSLVPYLG